MAWHTIVPIAKTTIVRIESEQKHGGGERKAEAQGEVDIDHVFLTSLLTGSKFACCSSLIVLVLLVLGALSLFTLAPSSTLTTLHLLPLPSLHASSPFLPLFLLSVPSLPSLHSPSASFLFTLLSSIPPTHHPPSALILFSSSFSIPPLHHLITYSLTLLIDDSSTPILVHQQVLHSPPTLTAHTLAPQANTLVPQDNTQLISFLFHEN